MKTLHNTDTAPDNSGTVRRAFIKSLPVMAGYIVLGTGFGILAYSKGLGLIWPVLMSIFIYAGSMQYVAVGLLSSGAGFITLALTALAVNARHLLYGISMLDKYKDSGRKKPYLVFSLTDETYSLLVREDENKRNNNPGFYLLVSLFDQCYWVLGSIIGVAAGRFIPINTKGIDFSLTALFITVAVDQWCEGKKHWPAIAGALSAVICRLIFGPDSFLIPTMLAIVIVLSAPDIFERIRSRRRKGAGNE
ncbi:MAG: AzlC family ABC transporter permease [Parasporobacterium sp.]|nr:AzlC family ABC transporter permease [Parasporobacterium sp.]